MKRKGRCLELAGAVAAVLFAATGSLALTGVAQAARTPSATPTPTPSPASAQHRVTITLLSLDPKAVQPHDTIVLDGTITNISGAPLTSVSVAARASATRIDTRFDLARDNDPNVVLGATVSNTRVAIGPLAAGQSAHWTILLPVDRLNLPSSAADFGAYPLAVDARTTSGRIIATTRLPTQLLWMPTGAQFTPTQISWLVPLVDGIHRGAGNTFLDDQLATDLAPSGRLGRLLSLASAARVPITYAIDPALVDDATVMAGAAQLSAGVTGVTGVPPPSGIASPSAPASSTAPPSPKPSTTPKEGSKSADATPPAAVPTPYQVAAGDTGGTTNGTGESAATDWLATLHSDVSAPGAAVVGLPYGDTDLVAVERAGLTREIAIARSTGQSTLTADLVAPSLPNVVWPVGGTIDEPTLNDLAGDFVDTVVLTDTTLPPRNANAVTGARTNLQTASGTVRAVLTDSTLSSMLSTSTSVDGGVRVAEQRFLAETMLVTEQRPGVGSSVVIAPARNWNPTDGFATTLLADSATMPWLQGVNVGQVADQPADGVPRQSLVYTAAASAAEMPGEDLLPIAALRGRLVACSAVLGSSTTETFISTSSIAILRAESAGLRTDLPRAAAIRAAVQAELGAQIAKVYIVKPGLITLTSRKQKIPITVVNNLPDPVTVEIRITAVNAARLTVAAQEPFTVPGNQSRHQVLIEVEATTGGRFDVAAQLWTPDASPRPFGPPVPFVMNSTAYGTVALVIAATAAGLVFLVSAIRVVRRLVASRRTPHDGPQRPAAAADSSSVS
ncbi:MAG TPA: DUF6049 family protein [Acidothermaceae bacterium]|nr:DUF6049 family protein [Acidothermaceae bacterium]